MPLTWRLLFRSWKQATFDEIKAFVGMKLNMALVQLSQLKDYWFTHETLNLQFFHRVFSRDNRSEHVLPIDSKCSYYNYTLLTVH